MYDDDQFHPPESDEENNTSGRRRGFSKWIWFVLGLFAIVIVAVVFAATAAFLSRDAGRQVASEASGVPAGASEETLEEVAGPLTDEPLRVDPAEAGGPVTQTPSEESSSEPEQPPATPTAEPPVEPTAEPTAAPTATEPVTPEASPEPISGRIAVVDNRARLWTFASDGSDRRLLSGPGRFYQFPSWSPAGNEIAVIGNDSEAGGVYVVADEDDGEIRQLYADSTFQPIYLYWSPEGQNVSFIANHPGGLALHMAPGDGGLAPQLVATSPGTFFWDWMPDGSQVLVHTGFTARSSDNSRLAFVPLNDDGEPEEIMQRGFFQAPAVAADGRYFSYGNEDASGNRWLSIHDRDSDQQVEVVSHQGVLAMGFSPTRPQLAFTSPGRPAQSFFGALRLIDLESRETRMLEPEPVLAFFWSPDGLSIAYLTLSTIDKLFDFDDAPVAESIDLPAKKGALGKALPTLQDDDPRFGLAVTVVDVESGESRLLTVFEPSTVFLNQFLPFFDQYAHSHRLWSPDSQALVLPMKNEQDRSFIVVVPADGSDPQPIAPGVAAFWSQHR
ncbi:MAG: hypothetical protein JSW55_08290 [Chloroflexota bacterium]|nr:MAG: hypothetical protein JSW55_08290 [Chloroflexota bacterium]